MNFKNSKSILLIFLVLFCFSCTPYKSVPYFQNLKQDSVIAEKITNYSPLTIQPGDILGVNVSSLNHDADLIVNYNLERTPGIANIDRLEQNAVYGYLVNNEGVIHMPYIGDTKVTGLTTSAVITTLESKLAQYLTSPIVKVRIENFKISIIGDVKVPGVYNIGNEKIAITEAMALAGDLNTTGMRNNVLLIREKDGTREYIRLDLTSKSIFNSPYYYLKSNDVIYVQPNRDRVASTDSAFSKVALIISALSLVAIFFTRAK